MDRKLAQDLDRWLTTQPEESEYGEDVREAEPANMGDINEQIKPHINYDPNAGCHIRRPFADDQRAVDIPPLCGGNRYETYRLVAEDGELPDTWPDNKGWCQKCVEVHNAGREKR